MRRLWDNMKVKDLMRTNVTFLKESATFNDIAREMISKDIGFIPICNDQGNILGAITDRDLMIKAFDTKENTNSIRAKDIMTRNLTVISANDDIHQVSLIFSKSKVHRLPVVENKRLVGILSISDLAKHRIYLSEVGNILHYISISDLINTKERSKK